MRLIALTKAQQNRPPAWFAVVSIGALLWNGVGIARFVQYSTMPSDLVALLSASEQALYANTPMWTHAALGVAFFTGTLGALLLVIRKRRSAGFLYLSLAAMLVYLLHPLVLTRSADVLGPAALVVPLLGLAIAVFLALLGFKARLKGWTV